MSNPRRQQLRRPRHGAGSAASSVVLTIAASLAFMVRREFLASEAGYAPSPAGWKADGCGLEKFAAGS